MHDLRQLNEEGAVGLTFFGVGVSYVSSASELCFCVEVEVIYRI